MDFLKVPLGAAGVIAAERDSGGTRNLIDDPPDGDSGAGGVGDVGSLGFDGLGFGVRTVS